MSMRARTLPWILLVSLSGCMDEDAPEDLLEPEDQDPAGAEDGKLEAWNSANNPAYVDSTFIQYAHQLPVAGGREKAPIPGDYWATFKDSLNVKWDGASSQSAAEKYGKAFGRSDVEDLVSQANGVKGASTRKACTTTADCSDLMDGSECSASYDGAVKRCIPTWWGICHGWAPYALSEPAARNPVTRQAADGSQVTFYPGDLEGLMSMLYTNVATKFISQRCNKDEPPTDANGRVILGECRDMNPGTWHVVVTNLMGLRQQGFVLDQTFDDEVWNQPAWSYRITNPTGQGLTEVTRAQALEILGIEGTLTPLLTDRQIRKDEFVTGSHTATVAGTYRVKLTGTGDADLYVKKGEAPTLSSYDCRPYEGSSAEDCDVNLVAGEVVFFGVHGYAADSKVSLGVSAPGSQSAEYVYNPAAKKFFYVAMDFTFIVESRPGRTSHVDQASAYSQTKHYEYLLETDEFLKILGGEWVGGSTTDHPDFAWWPTAKPSSQTAGIGYADVKAMNDEAAGGVTPPPDKVQLLQNHTISTSGQWNSKYANLEVEAGVKQLKVTMTGSGDADLYVRRGQNPTVYTFNCSSTTAGTSDETCTVDVASSGGIYYVRARTRTPGTTVSITAEKLR